MFVLGQSYGGGIIFYIDGTGLHGLIAAPSDQGSGDITWGCSGISIPGTSWSIGTGQYNTMLIVLGCSELGIAARICDNLELNGYSDWFLPSSDELYLMYLQKDAIGAFGTQYWCSSEYDADDAWVLDFYSGYNEAIDKSSLPSVRAVRAF